MAPTPHSDQQLDRFLAARDPLDRNVLSRGDVAAAFEHLHRPIATHKPKARARRRRPRASRLALSRALIGALAAGLLALGALLLAGEVHHSQLGPTSSGARYPANIDFPPEWTYGQYSSTALSLPAIGASDINMNMAQVEPQQGSYNWAPADSQLAAWAKAGKKVNLIIRYASEADRGSTCSNTGYMPAWEVARIPTFCDGDAAGGVLIPDYFNATFQSDIKAYAAAIANHFASSPYRSAINYVRMAVGLGGEGFPDMPLSSNPDYSTVDIPHLQSWGFSGCAWANFQKAMMTAYKSDFWYTTVIYPMNGDIIDNCTGQDVRVENAKWAAANGIGVGQQGLVPPTTSLLLQQLRTEYPNIYIQFQTIGRCSGLNEVQGDITAAFRNGAQFVEWYQSDATNSSYQSTFGQWQSEITQRYG